MFRRFLPHVGEHVLKRLHVLSCIPDKGIFIKTGNVDLCVPSVFTFEKFLMNLKGFFHFILRFLLDRSDPDNSVIHPFHVTQSFGIFLDN
jgi:hypothetical protein